MNASDVIGTRPSPTCLVCGSAGTPLYTDMTDRLFFAPGRWTLVQCVAPDCGLLWLNPLPLEGEIGRAYRDYYTHDESETRPARVSALLGGIERAYLRGRYGYHLGLSFSQRLLGLLISLYPGYAAELDLSVMWLDASRRGRLLDIGSGSGWLVEHLNTLGWRAEGLDFDPRAVEKARLRGLTVHLGDLASQRFPDGVFDAVTMCHSLEHVHDPLSWLAEVRRVIRPGGCVAIATPNSAALGHRLFGANWLGLDPPRHLQIFNVATLRRLLEKAGFSRIHVFTSPRHANGNFLASRSIRRSGRFAMGAPQPLGARLTARIAQAFASATHWFQPESGEDLVAVAEK
ncbi:MAG TPA: class I SAM-dependent methyltransferase [Burkholderiales bacterium]|nr:class I SAM-dependent methyltransferase [Burkholderiales bacterium]